MWGYLKWLLILGMAALGIALVFLAGPAGFQWRLAPGPFIDGTGVEIEVSDSDLTSVCWSYGGGELGGSHIYTLTRKGNTAELEVFTREEWGAPETTRTCVVSASTLDDIAAIVEEFNLVEAQNNGGDHYVLDGDTWSLEIEYADGTRALLQQHQEFSDGEYEGIFAIRDMLEELFESNWF